MKFESVLLGDVCELIAGFAFKSKDFETGEGRVIKIAHITPPVVDMDNLAVVNLQNYNLDKIEKYIARQGDFVLAMTGATIGKIGRIENGSAYINQRVLMFKNHDNIDKDYLYYVLQQYEFEQYVLSHIDSQSAQPNISAGTIGKYELDLPDLNMQKKIGKFLRLFDAKIALNNKINNNLEQQASIMITRYLAFTNSEVKFADIMHFENGFAFSSRSYLSEGQYKIITIKNVQDGQIDSANVSYVNELPFRMKEGCKLCIGDVLLSLTGNVGRVGIVCEDNLLLNQRVAKFVPHSKELLPFLYFVFRQSKIKAKLESISRGTAQANLSPVETLDLTIKFEQTSAELLSMQLEPLYQALIRNTQEISTLVAIRDTLLPKLMSGELDVSEIEL